jgi:isopenicillin-N epimerase
MLGAMTEQATRTAQQPNAGKAAQEPSNRAPRPLFSEHKRYWSRLDPEKLPLNHGSFGACPDAVIDQQTALRDQIEADPTGFIVERLEPLRNEARAAIARFLGADEEGLVFVDNATTGVNAVLRSLAFRPGDEILITDHEYNACRNAAHFVASRWKARVAEVRLGSRGGHVVHDDQIFDQILSRVTPSTRLAMISHITSPTGIVLPVERLTSKLEAAGVRVLIDGAHAPGMLPINLRDLNASYYTGNFHKWPCAPRGAAFLYVGPGKRGEWEDFERRTDAVRPTVISHGANERRRDINRLHAEFDWTGTRDVTPELCVPAALDALASVLPGGLDEMMQRNRAVALQGRVILRDRLGLNPMCPEHMIGSLAALRLPDRPGDSQSQKPGVSVGYPEPLQTALVTGEHKAGVPIQVPIIPWPKADGSPGGRLVRISAHLYNTPDAYHLLADALEERMHTL